jgi:hypothetical protein
MILIVRHGKGRGRVRKYLQPLLKTINASDAELFAQIRVHETGAEAPSLQGVRAVVFWLGDPLRELYPECYAEAMQIAEAAQSGGIRIVNHPDALSNTIKSRQQRIWSAAGLTTAMHHPLSDRAELEARASKLEYPLFIRSDQLHAQRHMQLCQSAEEVIRIPDERLVFPATATPFVDTRSCFSGRGSGSPWSRFYHRKRAFVFGDIVRTNNVYFSEQPIVAWSTSTYLAYGQRGHPRSEVLSTARCLLADYLYWRQGSEHEELLLRAASALGLEFAAIDYSSFGDGSVILWEANPHFTLRHWRNDIDVWPGWRRLEQRYASFGVALATFFRTLLDAE